MKSVKAFGDESKEMRRKDTGGEEPEDDGASRVARWRLESKQGLAINFIQLITSR